MDLNMTPPPEYGGLDLNMEPPQDVYVQVLDAAAPQDVNIVQGGLYAPPQVLAAAHINGGLDLNMEVPQDVADGNIVQGGLDTQPQVLPAVNANAVQGRKDTPLELRKRIYQALLARSKNGTLGKNVTKEIAELFTVHLRTVQRIWRRGKSSLSQGIPVDVANRKRGRVGRKRVPLDLEPLRNVPLKKRTTLEDVRAALGISKKKLLRYIKEGHIKRHSNSIKPHLTDANKKARLKWCVDMLEFESMLDPRFKGLFDVVFIDEKWFYLTRKSEKYYLLADEDEPLRTCRSKNNIPKIMFIRIKKEVIRMFMIEKVLPAIRAKWPREDVSKPIYIQQDNAPSHLDLDDPQFCEAAKQEGFDIRLVCQPANSPNFNILDLGFFRAIQSIQYKKNARTIQELIPAVQEAFHEYSPCKANRIYLTLQQVWKEAMKAHGSNKFKTPHMKKNSLEIQGRLPLQITCEASLVADAMAKLAAWNI